MARLTREGTRLCLVQSLILQWLEVVGPRTMIRGQLKMGEVRYTPALGYSGLTPAYDLVVRMATRERTWRMQMLEQVHPQDGEAILDVGCGTGTFAILCKQRAPRARVVGIDPDPQALAIAAEKAGRAGVQVEWVHGYAHDAAGYDGQFDLAVSSLMFHQVHCEDKRAGVEAMLKAVRPGGEIHIADYCRQPDGLMRRLFRIVQSLDGHETTQPNADGAIERLLSEYLGSPAEPNSVIRTPTGAISLFRVIRQTGRS